MCLQAIQFNNREIAALIWIGLVVLFLASKPKLRTPGWQVVKSFFQWKIQAVLLAAIGWTVASSWLLAQFRIWRCENLKTTIIWGLTFMFVTLMETATKGRSGVSVKEIIRDALAATAAVVFIAEFYTFPLWAELLLLPALTFIGGMVAVAEIQKKPEHRPVLALLKGLLSLAGLSVLAFSLYQIFQHPGEFLSLGTAREFAVPIMLSILYVPFLYAVLVVSTYEQAAVQLHFRIEDKRLRRAAYYRGMFAFGANVELVKRYLRALNVADTLDRARISEAISEVRRISRREKNPPLVDWEKGWSPYDAQGFLTDAELRTSDYHRSFDDWWAESPSVKLNEDFLADRIVYRIAGTETAVTRLTLTLYGNIPGSPEIADARFWELAERLIARALGDETVEGFTSARVGNDRGSMQAGRFAITWKRDEWGKPDHGGFSRSLSILHPAHSDPYSD